MKNVYRVALTIKRGHSPEVLKAIKCLIISMHEYVELNHQLDWDMDIAVPDLYMSVDLLNIVDSIALKFDTKPLYSEEMATFANFFDGMNIVMNYSLTPLEEPVHISEPTESADEEQVPVYDTEELSSDVDEPLARHIFKISKESILRFSPNGHTGILGIREFYKKYLAVLPTDQDLDLVSRAFKGDIYFTTIFLSDSELVDIVKEAKQLKIELADVYTNIDTSVGDDIDETFNRLLKLAELLNDGKVEEATDKSTKPVMVAKMNAASIQPKANNKPSSASIFDTNNYKDSQELAITQLMDELNIANETIDSYKVLNKELSSSNVILSNDIDSLNKENDRLSNLLLQE